ncbi:uncharacterized protein [Bactrocera oleae]|uniref:uncharacterized protein n=1 Tax=Bactrocera oleae TaxID=104688 RepID=UPI0006B6A66F|nr:uncharacterized protein LOC106620407 [Bactrocera oleae]XP_036224833.1 uncharacterized protein LOC106620407 [Bactrocera oleae]
MARFYALAAFTLCAILAVSVVSGGIVRDSSNEIAPEKVRPIMVVKDINEFKRKHPGLSLLALKKESGQARSGSTVEYKLGGRVQGDFLAAQIADAFNYEDAKDVTVQLTYPQAGTGSIVTYVLIRCEADSTEGNAYVVAGGIGQRFISIVLESTATQTFSYNAQFYGSN